MREEFFNQQMGRCEMMHPNSRRWNEDIRSEYWQSLRGQEEGDFQVAVSTCLREVAFFPTLAELYKRLPERAKSDPLSEPLESCGECYDGVRYLTSAKGYEKIAACRCPRGEQRVIVRYGGKKMRFYDQIFGE